MDKGIVKIHLKGGKVIEGSLFSIDKKSKAVVLSKNHSAVLHSSVLMDSKYFVLCREWKLLQDGIWAAH